MRNSPGAEGQEAKAKKVEELITEDEQSVLEEKPVKLAKEEVETECLVQEPAQEIKETAFNNVIKAQQSNKRYNLLSVDKDIMEVWR